MNTKKTPNPPRQLICRMCKIDGIACKYGRMTGKCIYQKACEHQLPVYK